MFSYMLQMVGAFSILYFSSGMKMSQNEQEVTPGDQVSGDFLIDHQKMIKLPNVVRQEKSICEKKTTSSIFTYGKCPGVCSPFSPTLFNECGSLIQFGCELVSCGGFNFKCVLKEDLSEDVVVCAGDKVVFDSVELERLQNVKFSIDLQVPPKQTDLYLLSDATGSMGVAINTVKTKINGLLDVFDGRNNVAYGIGYYRDERDANSGFKNLQSITENPDNIRNVVTTLRASGGGDRDEANLVAMYKVATDASIGWRKQSRKFLVYFGDFPGHEPSCNTGIPRLDRKIVVDALKKQGITVIAVDFRGLDNAPLAYSAPGLVCPGTAGTGQATFITTETSGTLVAGTDQAKLIDLIEEGIAGVQRTFDVDESECVENIDSVHTPLLPLSLAPGASSTVTNTLSVKASVCEVGGSFECNYKYSESGADLPSTKIELVNIKGCP